MPPIAKCGSPCAMCASTSTTVPSRPDRATERVRPSPWRHDPTPTTCRSDRGPPGPAQDADDVDAHLRHRRPAGVAREVGRRQPPQPHRLGEGHRLDRLAEPRRPTGLDLADDEAVAVARDDVDLAVLAAPVAVEHLHALLAQVAHGQRLAVAAQRSAGRGGRACRRRRGARRSGRGGARWRVGAGHDRSQPARRGPASTAPEAVDDGIRATPPCGRRAGAPERGRPA